MMHSTSPLNWTSQNLCTRCSFTTSKPLYQASSKLLWYQGLCDAARTADTRQFRYRVSIRQTSNSSSSLYNTSYGLSEPKDNRQSQDQRCNPESLEYFGVSITLWKRFFELNDMLQEPEFFSGSWVMCLDSNSAIKGESITQKGHLHTTAHSYGHHTTIGAECEARRHQNLL